MEEINRDQTERERKREATKPLLSNTVVLLLYVLLLQHGKTGNTNTQHVTDD